MLVQFTMALGLFSLGAPSFVLLLAQARANGTNQMVNQKILDYTKRV